MLRALLLGAACGLLAGLVRADTVGLGEMAPWSCDLPTLRLEEPAILPVGWPGNGITPGTWMYLLEPPPVRLIASHTSPPWPVPPAAVAIPGAFVAGMTGLAALFGLTRRRRG